MHVFTSQTMLWVLSNNDEMKELHELFLSTLLFNSSIL